MHIISRRALRLFWTAHPPAKTPLQAWYEVARHTRWESFADVRAVYASADQVDRFTVFNIGGNKYRLICVIHFNRGKVFIRHVLTHEDYDTGAWKSG